MLRQTQGALPSSRQHRLHVSPSFAAHLVRTHPRPIRAVQAHPDHIHISETAVLVGSAVVSVAAPLAWSWVKANRIQELLLSDACKSAAEQVLLDVRTEEQRAAQGLPALPPHIKVVSAPWMVELATGYGRHNVHFHDDVTFAAHHVEPNTPMIVMDMTGECSKEASRAVAKLGTHCQVQVAKGGFEAWRKAGLPIKPVLGYTSYDLDVAVEDLLLELEEEPEEEPIFRPKMLDAVTKDYTLADLKSDILSGLVVGVIALSLSMALGIASESTPAIGLVTAVVSGFLISVLGGSRVNIGGPTAAFIPIVLGVAHNYGVENLVICTGMSGLMLIAMGASGLGTAIKFIPKPVVTGFTAGIATYIFSTQIKDFLGLGVPGALPEGAVVPSQFLEKLYFLGSHLDGVHLPSLALASASLALTLAWPKPWAKVAPPQIVAVVAATGGLVALDHLTGGGGAHAIAEGASVAATAATGAFGIETIGSHFGADAIPSNLPMPHWPSGLTSIEQLGPLVQPAISIALLGSIESLLCARVADTMIADKHNPNTELIAQGVANIASSAFGGLPATAALARTAANVRAGGRSPVAGIVHALTIYTVMAVASPLAGYIPLPALSAVLVVVAINMGEWRHFRQLPSWPEKDAQLYLLAFFLTVMQDVAVAVELGMAAAVLLFVRDVTGSLHVRSHREGDFPNQNRHSALPQPWLTATDDEYEEHKLLGNVTSVTLASVAGSLSLDEEDERITKLQPMLVPQGAAFLDVTGSLQFGAGAQLEKSVGSIINRGAHVRVLILGMSHLNNVDVSGLEVLEEISHGLHKAGVSLVIVGPTRQPLQMMSRAGFFKEVGSANVCRTLEQAFSRAEELVTLSRISKRSPSPVPYSSPTLATSINRGRSMSPPRPSLQASATRP